jgi:pimeloyl-[acyl-carrier protein] synthase
MVPENPFHPDFRANPYPLYHYMRSMEPVHHSKFGWLLTRHEDCRAVLDHEDRFSHDFAKHAYYRQWEAEGWQPGPVHALLGNTLTFQDAPHHTHSKARLASTLASRPSAELQPNIDEHVERLLDSAIAAGGMDAIADFAHVLPLAVVGDWIGIPREDIDRVRAWTAQLTPVLDALLVLDVEAQGMAAELGLRGYLSTLIDERRAQPRPDLLSAILAGGPHGERMTSWDVATNCMFLLIASHDATANMLGNGLLALLRNPDQLQLLTDQPELAPGAVEEILRYDSPFQLSSRATMEEVDFGGVSIPKGEDVVLVIGAANRDPARFREPDRFDICRDASGHLAFSDGPHACLGAPLARSIGVSAFRSVALRLPGIRLATDADPVRRDTVTLRGLTSLPVVV